MTATKLSASLLALCLAGCTSATNSNSNSNTNINRASTTNSAMNTVSDAANTVANTVSNTAAGLTTDSPDQFLRTAAQSGLAEVEMGKIAATKAQNAEVKAFGSMMAADHGKANTELKTLAASKKVELPADMGSHRSTMDDLSKRTGADFDKEYVEAMVEAHETDVAAFEKQANNATDAEVKAFAAKTLPTLRAHLEKIKAIQSKMN